MKKYFLLLPLLLISCSGGNTSSEESSSSISFSSSENESLSSENSSSQESLSEQSSSLEQSSELSSSENQSSESSSQEEIEDESKIDHITLSKTSLDLIVGKYEYLAVNFFPDDETTSELHDGVWSTSDESIVTVSQYGKVTAIKEGKAIVTFTTNHGNRRGNCVVYVFESAQSIVREYVKVTDADSLVPGDQIIFACPEFGVAASINRKDGYLKPVTASFSSDGNKLVSFGEDTGEYFIGEGIDDSLTLENQNNQYLEGKTNDYRNSLNFQNSKGQINWIFETPVGYEGEIFCVNYDLEEDLWLMFNKINDSDIRFNLYDSNETALLKKPTIYRYEITNK